MMMPYNMDYAMPSHQYHTTADMAANDLYSLHMATGPHDGGVGAVASGMQTHGDGSLGAESQLSQVVNLAGTLAPQQQQQLQQQQLQQQQQQQHQQQLQQQQQSLVGLSSVPKVKRQDRDLWAGTRFGPSVLTPFV